MFSFFFPEKNRDIDVSKKTEKGKKMIVLLKKVVYKVLD
jgi:hypothetical protein